MRPLFEICWMWIFPWIKLLTLILCVIQSWMTQLILAILTMMDYLPLIRKDSVTHMYGLGVYVKQGLPFAQNVSLENSVDSNICFWLALLHSVSYFFYLYWSPLLLCMLFILFHQWLDQSFWIAFVKIYPFTNLSLCRVKKDENIQPYKCSQSTGQYISHNNWKQV